MSALNEKYEVIVGLEIHAELSTKTKIFCGCKNAFGAEVNTLCCPVCMGMPGTLPVLNRQVVDYAVTMGHALGCSIACRKTIERTIIIRTCRRLTKSVSLMFRCVKTVRSIFLSTEK